MAVQDFIPRNFILDLAGENMACDNPSMSRL